MPARVTHSWEGPWEQGQVPFWPQGWGALAGQSWLFPLMAHLADQPGSPPESFLRLRSAFTQKLPRFRDELRTHLRLALRSSVGSNTHQPTSRDRRSQTNPQSSHAIPQIPSPSPLPPGLGALGGSAQSLAHSSDPQSHPDLVLGLSLLSL